MVVPFQVIFPPFNGFKKIFVLVPVNFLIDAIVGNRVSPAAEIEGLDIPEMGVPGYVGVKLDKFSETPLTSSSRKPGSGPKSDYVYREPANIGGR